MPAEISIEILEMSKTMPTASMVTLAAAVVAAWIYKNLEYGFFMKKGAPTMNPPTMKTTLTDLVAKSLASATNCCYSS